MVASLSILGGVCIVGMLVTSIFTRDMGRSLEENEITEPQELEEIDYH